MRTHLPTILAALVFGGGVALAGDAPATPAAAPAATPAPASDLAKERSQKVMDSATPVPDEGRAAAERSRRSVEHCAVGRRLYEARLFEEARQELELAVRLDPSNEEAKKLLQLADATLMMRRSRVQTAVQALDQKEKIERQEQLNELQNHLDRAWRLYNDATPGKEKGKESALSSNPEVLSAQLKQLEESGRELARGREIVKWMDARVPVKSYETSLEALQDQVFKESKRREVALEDLGRKRAAEEANAQRTREAEFREKQIRMLMDKANMLFDRRDYEEAARLARRVMELDPTNPDAVEMETSCRWKAIDLRRENTADLKKEYVRDWVEISQRAMVPHSKLLVYPRDWAEVSRRGSPEEKRLSEPEWKRDIAAALEKEFSIDFVDQPLEECLKYLQGLTTVPIIKSPEAFAAGGATAGQLITLRLTKTKLGLALRWILRMARLDYTFKDGAIYITTPDKMTGELVQKIYDVRDLTSTLTNFPGPQLGLSGGTGGAGGGVGGAGAGGAGIAAAPEVAIVPPGTLADLIKKVIQPATWGGAGGANVTENNGQLIVFHTQEVHAQIGQLLEDFRKSQTLQVHVEARYLDVRQGFCEEIGIDWNGDQADMTWPLGGPPAPVNPNLAGLGNWPGPASNGVTVPNFRNHPDEAARVAGFHSDPGYNPNSTDPEELAHPRNILMGTRNTFRQIGDLNITSGLVRSAGTDGLTAIWSYLGNFQARAIMKAVKKEEKGTVLFAPRLTMFNNQRAHILIGIQESYVGGWSGSGGVSTANVQTAYMDAVSLDVRPIVSHDRRYITMELRPTLVRPAPYPPTPTGGVDPGNPNQNTTGLGFTLPALEIREIRTVVTVPDGGTALLSGLMTEAGSNQRSGIPFLMNLPVVGRVFSLDFKDTERRNLLILVTARLILFSEEESKL